MRELVQGYATNLSFGRAVTDVIKISRLGFKPDQLGTWFVKLFNED